jgi:predicted RNase H-like nuclease (RuvC/YqgF family)
MTKRSLTDMLRAETQKAAIEPETKAEEPTAEATETKTTAVKKTVAKASVATPTSTTTDSSPALEALVNGLKADLEKSRDREADLEQQVTDLQAEVKASRVSSEQLKAYPEQVNQLKAELDRVKKDNLQLAEANIKLTQAAKEASAIAPVPQSRAQLDIQPTNPSANQEPEPKLTAAQEQAAHLTRILRRPVGSNRALSKVSDKNIGWFD